MGKRQVTVYNTKEDEAEAVACIETDPRIPHGRLTADNRRYRGHAVLQFSVTRAQRRTAERVQKMQQSEQERNCGTSS
jgi:hypothetical protein